MAEDRPPRGFPEDIDALRARYAALRRLTVAQRLSIMDKLTQLAQSLCREGIRRRSPGITDEELHEEYTRLVLGSELAEKVLEHRRIRASRSEP